MKCKHKWVDMEDGSLDKLCVRCRKFAMQAIAPLPELNQTAESGLELATCERLELISPLVQEMINELHPAVSELHDNIIKPIKRSVSNSFKLGC